ncbi:MAG TPA: N-acetylmuramoyl-L-alanine amidase [Syntrophales bacterium]|nr:N-acetylmuramoyl-L-alanine amidase [Syntrophales bacterium]
MKGKLLRIFFLIVFFAAVFLRGGWVQAAGEVTNMRYWTAPDHTRIVFDLTEPPVFTTSRQDGSLSITFQETACAETVSRETKIGKSGIRQVAIIALKEGDVLVRLELENDVETNVFPLKKFLDKPDRLVVDIELPEVSRRESRKREQIRASKKKKIIILDPGHGGDDPGAVGKNGTREKDVVLAISRRLKKTLDRHGFFQAYLTRDGDYYVPFDERLQIAREYGADLFVSIHADAARNREARGSSVYCLSLGGASSVAAKILAQNENLADIVGGAREADMKEDTNPILINMCQTNTINVSKAFGMSVLWELSNIGELKFEKVQEAPFRVLKMPEIPAVLIETAYISNPEEEKLLRSPAFQNKLSATIARAVVQFFLSESSGEAPIVLAQGGKSKDPAAPVENRAKPFFLYTVEKGDTLSKIARRFNVTLSGLLTLNQLEADAPLYVGKKLKIEGERKDENGKAAQKDAVCDVTDSPGAKEPETPVGKTAKKPFFFYTVAKGDTLTRIADRFGMTLGSLLTLNRLKSEEPLHVGKRLRIEGVAPEAKINQKKERDADKTKKQDKRPLTTYRVKSGDTLLTIARRQGVSVGTLLKLNDMKLDDPLYKDRILILGEQNGNP